MIISMSAFTRRVGFERTRCLVRGLAFGLLLSVSGCQDRAQNVGSSQESKSALLSKLQANFDLALKGSEARQGAPNPATRMVEMPEENSAGISCKPARLTRDEPALQIELPKRARQRPVLLAAIVPDGGLRIIYTGYGKDVESIDIVVPSKTIDWTRAKKQSIFLVKASEFDALVPDAMAPSPLFIEPGVYQLALTNNRPGEIEDPARPQFQVLAGCVVDWRP